MHIVLVAAIRGPFPALVSANLAPFPVLTSATPTLAVTIGSVGPLNVTLAAVPATLATARNELQAALRNAHSSPGFSGAYVLSVGSRLTVVPGDQSDLQIAAAGADPTAAQLGLDAASARRVFALVGGPLVPYVAPTAPAPTVLATMGTIGPQPAALGAPLATLAQARAQLQAAIQAAHADPAFTGALVGTADSRLFVFPGTAGLAAVLSAPPGDPTLVQLRLNSDRPALAGSDGGELPATATTLVRTTVFGEVHVRELTLASEVIFTARLVADRRQAGCVRFSFVPRRSRTPRRYRCQPDLEIEAQVAAAKKLAEDNGTVLSPAEESAIRAAEALINGLKYPQNAHKLVKGGKMQPMVLVMMRPTVAPPRDTECMDVPGGPRTETFFTKDVPTAVAGHYRVGDHARNWGVIGNSTGGYCALKMAMRHPEAFSAAAGLSPSYKSPIDATTGDLFGGSKQLERENNLMWRLDHKPAPPVSLLVSSSEHGEKNYKATVKFIEKVKELNRRGEPTRISSIILNTGGHNFNTWRREVPAALQWLGGRLSDR